MYKYKMASFIIMVVVVLLTICGQSIAANYPLEIIQPRAGLDTKNRFYKAYPGFEYNVRVAVIGGAYPFTYTLTTAPSGMVINSSTGTISWSNPTTSGSPHSVTVQVTDQETTSTSVSWSITVTTSGFIFLDAVNGTPITSGGTGTISNPFKTLKDMYCGSDGVCTSTDKTTTTYQDYFMYFRTGTYYIDTLTENCGGIDCRAPFTGPKPNVWLTYPNEAVVLDCQDTYSVIFYTNINNVYVDGLEVKNMASYGFQFDSNGDYPVFRRLYMHRLGPTSGSNNQSFIRILAAGIGNYMVIQDSTFDDLDHGAAIKFYDTNKVLIEDNTISNFIDTTGAGIEGIALKSAVIRPTVRHNIIHDVTARGIGGNMNDGSQTTEQFEILFNDIYNASTNAIEINQDGQAGVIHVYRNTFVGVVDVKNTDTADGPFYFDNNVIVNNSGSANHITCGGAGCATQVIANNNLSGYPADGIVNSVGNLTSAYSLYLGTRGYQIDFTVPAIPKNLSVK